MFGVRAVQSLAGWLLTVLIARFLGPEQYGGYAFAFSFAGLFLIASDLGLNSFLIRELSASKPTGSAIFSNALVIKPILALIAFAMIAASINLLHYSSSIRMLVYLLGAQVVVRSFAGLFLSIVHSRQEMRLDTKAESIGRFSGVGLGLCALAAGLGLAGVIWGLLLGEILRLAYLYGVTRRHFTFRKNETSCRSVRSIVISALPFGFFSLMMSLNYKGDSVILSFFHGQTVVGTYYAAYHLVLVGLVLPTVVGGALYPSFSSSAAAEHRDKLNFPLSAAFRLMLLMGAAGSIVVYAWADQIVQLLYTRAYVDSGPCLKILAWSMVFMFPQYVLGAAMLAVGRERTQLAIWIVAVGLNMVFNLLFIPRFGAIAASVVTVCTECLLVVLFYAVMESEVNERIAGTQLWRLIAPLVLSFAGSSALAHFSVSMFFGIPLVGVILLGSVVAFQTFSAEEVLRYKRLLSMERRTLQ